MKCENIFCVYYDKGICSLQTTTLDIQGSCQECIYVSISEESLSKKRNEFLTKSLSVKKIY